MDTIKQMIAAQHRIHEDAVMCYGTFTYIDQVAAGYQDDKHYNYKPVDVADVADADCAIIKFAKSIDQVQQETFQKILDTKQEELFEKFCKTIDGPEGKYTLFAFREYKAKQPLVFED